MAPSPSKPSSEETHTGKKMTKSEISSFLKRKETLKKKAYELATLCDIPVCLLCFGSDGKVFTWPENKKEVKDIILRYKRDNNNNLQLGLDKNKRIKNHSLEQSLEKNKKIKNHNLEKIESLGKKIYELPEESLMELLGFLERKLKGIDERIGYLQIKDKGKEKMMVNENYCGEIAQQNPLLQLPNLYNNIVDLSQPSCSSYNNQLGFGNYNPNYMMMMMMSSGIAPMDYYRDMGITANFLMGEIGIGNSSEEVQRNGYGVTGGFQLGFPHNQGLVPFGVMPISVWPQQPPLVPLPLLSDDQIMKNQYQNQDQLSNGDSSSN